MAPGTGTRPHSPADARPVFEWLSRHGRLVLAAVVVLTLVAVIPATQRAEEEADFSPSGEVYDTGDLVRERFEGTSGVETALFVISGHDVLTRDVLLGLRSTGDELRSDPELSAHLATATDLDAGMPIDGIVSIADAVDLTLAPDGGLAGATDAELQAAVDSLLAPGSETTGLRDLLSQNAEQTVDGWASPALLASVAYDLSSFEVGASAPEIRADQQETEAEYFLRDVQEHLRSGVDASVYGIAIDGELTGEEQGTATAPFILGAVVVVVLLVGLVLRSYWVGALVAAGLGVTMIWFFAIVNLIGVEDSMLVTFIVPIATIAFGVDFFVHGYGRVREELADGTPPGRAYPVGLTAVIGALALALVSSAAAFLANSVSGIEAVIQFGVSAAVALGVAFVVLGVLSPLAVSSIERRTAPRSGRRGRLAGGIGFVLMTVVGGIAVTLAVMMPAIGAAAVAVFAVLFLGLPYLLDRRRAASVGQVVRGGYTGTDGSQMAVGRTMGRATGRTTGWVARHRRPVLFLVTVAALVGISVASNVGSKFSMDDFFSSDSDFIVGLDLLEEHYGDSRGRTGLLYLEGDLTDPVALTAIADAQAQLEASPTPLARQTDGTLSEFPDALDVARATVASPAAVAAVTERTGIVITDLDVDGLPDTPDQVSAVYETALEVGVVAPGSSQAPSGSGPSPTDGAPAGPTTMLLTPDDVASAIWTDGDTWATTLTVGIPTVTDAGIINGARDALEEVGDTLTSSPAADSFTVASVSGEAIEDQAGQDAFTRAMLLALPIALAAGLAAAALFMRSLRYGAVAVLPVLLVVIGLFAFMQAAGFSINPITATIAAIAVGVGIDFGTHLTIRFREELTKVADPVTAIERAGTGTGGALVMSALTSVLGFAVMALAPMPIFASFGLLTAVMIALSLAVSIIVLPGLLVAVTPARTEDPAPVPPAEPHAERELTGAPA